MKLVLAMIVGFVAATIAWLVLIAGQLGNHTPSSQWVREAYLFKNNRALAISEKKLVIVAGSNAMFGMNSSLLSEYYGRPVVNQGVNAGIGLPFIIQQAKKILKSGDIAILPIEHGLYNYDEETNQVMVDYYFTESDLFSGLSWGMTLKMLAKISLKRIYQGYRGLPDGFKVEGLYGPQNMDANGDQINSSTAYRHASQLDALENQPPSHYGAEAPEAPLAWRLLGDFQRYADHKNICLIYIPSTMMYNAFYTSDATELDFYQTLPIVARAKGLTYLGQPLDFMYKTESYFDTNYHLVSEMRARHTTTLISLLGKDLRDHCPRR